MESIVNNFPKEKEALYPYLEKQLAALLKGERNAVANMSNASALLNMALTELNWVGFYALHGQELVLGPFQGKPACIRIPVGQGVCGTAAHTAKTQLVPDVHAFAGHIACDEASRSEIVLPIFSNGKLVAVLDLDSPSLARFDQRDQAGLEQLAKLIGESSDW